MNRSCANVLIVFVLIVAIIATIGFLTALYKADNVNNVSTSYALCLNELLEAGIDTDVAVEACQP